MTLGEGFISAHTGTLEARTSLAPPAMRQCRLDVSAGDLSLAHLVCDSALNLPFARTVSSSKGPKAAMTTLYGRTVKVLACGNGVIKDRPLALRAQHKKRRSGPSGKSNWPRGTRQERAEGRQRRAQRRQQVDREVAAALRQAAQDLDSGRGAFAVRCLKQQLAILRLRDEAATLMNVSPDELSPSAAIVATLVPAGPIPSWTTGCFTVVADDEPTGLRAGTAMPAERGDTLCEFPNPGLQCGLVFHQN